MPAVSIALELLLGPGKPKTDPILKELNTKLDTISNKIDSYQKETMQAFKEVKAAICDS
jgi:hypothetical protein